MHSSRRDFFAPASELVDFACPICFAFRADTEAQGHGRHSLFAHGGPSHLETYDLKPSAPDEIRSFSPFALLLPVSISANTCRCTRSSERFQPDRPVRMMWRPLRRTPLVSSVAMERTRPVRRSRITRWSARSRRAMPRPQEGTAAVAVLGHVVLNGPDTLRIAQGYWPAGIGRRRLQRPAQR